MWRCRIAGDNRAVRRPNRCACGAPERALEVCRAKLTAGGLNERRDTLNGQDRVQGKPWKVRAL
eukprot:scaffold30832_cov67-Phaeocystis_antarctica.AAC.7